MEEETSWRRGGGDEALPATIKNGQGGWRRTGELGRKKKGIGGGRRREGRRRGGWSGRRPCQLTVWSSATAVSSERGGGGRSGKVKKNRLGRRVFGKIISTLLKNESNANANANASQK